MVLIIDRKTRNFLSPLLIGSHCFVIYRMETFQLLTREKLSKLFSRFWASLFLILNRFLAKKILCFGQPKFSLLDQLSTKLSDLIYVKSDGISKYHFLATRYMTLLRICPEGIPKNALQYSISFSPSLSIKPQSFHRKNSSVWSLLGLSQGKFPMAI